MEEKTGKQIPFRKISSLQQVLHGPVYTGLRPFLVFSRDLFGANLKDLEVAVGKEEVLEGGGDLKLEILNYAAKLCCAA